jgi:shikimate kinase
MPLWLIGMMGAGKTAVGRLVAAAKEVPFLDTDEMVEQEAGSTIIALWEVEGEAGFRRREAAAVARAASTGEAVVATGGGAVLSEDNARHLRRGTVVWLTASPPSLAQRLAGAGGRPLLATGNPHHRLGELLADREERYRALAHFVVPTDGLSVEEVAERVESLWNGS